MLRDQSWCGCSECLGGDAEGSSLEGSCAYGIAVSRVLGDVARRALRGLFSA